MIPRRALSLLLALALPIVALAVMVARAEIVSRSGRPYRIHITGYDPRDPIRGHYLRYRLDFLWDDLRERCTTSTCAYCLRGPAGSEPLVSKVSPNGTGTCDASFPESQLDHLTEFYIPEGRGPVLERALRSQRADLLVRVSSGGGVVIQDLLLDGVPWRDAVK
jgi:uncharacterized membrane-anchored protein